MNITLIYENHAQQNATALLLLDAGFTVNQTFPLHALWVDTTRQQPPDMLVIIGNEPYVDITQRLKILSQHPVCPVIVIANTADTSITREIMLAGADTCITGRLSADRIQSFIEVACIRFELTQGMHKTIVELQEKIAALECRVNDRCDIDRAKGLLMHSYNMNEIEANNAIRYMAMDSGSKLGEVARNLISMAKVLN